MQEDWVNPWLEKRWSLWNVEAQWLEYLLSSAVLVSCSVTASNLNLVFNIEKSASASP